MFGYSDKFLVAMYLQIEYLSIYIWFLTNDIEYSLTEKTATTARYKLYRAYR